MPSYSYDASWLKNYQQSMDNPRIYTGDGMPFDGSTLDQMAIQASIYGADQTRASAKEANETNIKLAREATEFNREQAQKQMDFQERMSNTAHQREMQDLIAAGLNPILTATGGNGASSPSGSSASAISARVDPTVKSNPYENLVSDTLSAKRFREIEKKQQALNEKQYDISMKELAIAEKKLIYEGILVDDTLRNSSSARALTASNISRNSYLNMLTSKQADALAKDVALAPLFELGAEALTGLIDRFTGGASGADLINNAIDKAKESTINMKTEVLKKQVEKQKGYNPPSYIEK